MRGRTWGCDTRYVMTYMPSHMIPCFLLILLPRSVRSASFCASKRGESLFAKLPEAAYRHTKTIVGETVKAFMDDKKDKEDLQRLVL